MLTLCRTPHHPRLNPRLLPLEVSLRTSFRLFATSISNSDSTVGSWNLLETHRQYQPQVVEDPRLCAPLWRDCLAKKPKVGKPFCMLLPPPNITGDLHLGHALTAAIQDAICRWQHMKGGHVLWIPGMDHAGLATQMIVERHLFGHTCNHQGSVNPRLQMGREAFVQEVWKWKDSKETSILAQLHRLGLVLDWSREYFTLSPEHSKAVNEALCRLFKAGLVYRSNSLIFWCCHLRSAISDIEVEHKVLTEMTKLPVPGYADPQPFGYVDVFDYRLASKSGKSPGTVPVATTRLETMLADTALAVHPKDTRYAHLIGQHVLHPFCNWRPIPIIADDVHVDPDQGTGVVKVSPGHSMIDWEIATRHGLKAISMLDDDGTVNFVGGPEFQDLPRFAARQRLVERLTELGLYRGRFGVGQSTEFLAPVGTISLPVCSRSGDVVEPLLRQQWFVNTDSMAEAALRAVQTGQLRISPSFHEPTWCEWLAPERRRHWCISRQVWWGHRMPAYRIPEKASADSQSTEYSVADFGCGQASAELTSKWVIARSPDEARTVMAEKLHCAPEDLPVLEQDCDVLDTWFSSGLLPLSALGWPTEAFDLSRFYPLSLMETGQDILFFWVARMVMLAIQLTGKLPFNKILLHGLICDASGQKMSKSRGNTIDPLQLIEGVGKLKQHQIGPGISSLGADALRASLLAADFTRPAVAYSEENALDYRRFCNKVWQSMQFLLSVLTREASAESTLTVDTEDLWSRLLQPLSNCEETSLVDLWILYRLAQRSSQFNRTFSNLCSGSSTAEDVDPSHSLHNCVSDLRYWWTEELCSVYLEVVKQRLRPSYSRSTPTASLDVLIHCFLCGLRLLHPITPHLSEVLWQSLPPRLALPRESLLLQPYPKDVLASVHPDFEVLTAFIESLLTASSRVTSWRLTLGLNKSSKDSVGLLLLQPRQPRPEDVINPRAREVAAREITYSLTGLRCIDQQASFMTVPCGSDVHLHFDPEGVDFSAAETSLNSRLANQLKKARAVERKALTNPREGLSRSDSVKLSLIKTQIKELEEQLHYLLLCKNGPRK
ncbi:hypothetical protein SprV_0301043800 [Sparganum proliferum]